MEVCPAEFVAFSNRLADASGDAIRPYFRQPIPVDTKPDNSPVTIADRAGEAAIRDLISRHYPEHGIIGEEMGRENEDAEFVWVLDPIDGTTSFITGRPLFGTLIALTHGGQSVLGIIDQPISGERWLGALGQDSLLNNKKISTRDCAALNQAALDSTSLEYFNEIELAAFEAIEKVVAHRRYGTDCYAYGLLAAGFVDLVIEATLNFWDFAALVPVIEGAGGFISDWNGDTLGPDSDGRIVAAGDRRIHKAALEILNAA
jgi:inositol-phosphate phosphatase/L-galactose 1-phosphate phosphatase/histidinol-phosphatase